MYDVIIIGAGISGSSIAYYLSQYNIKVAVLEASNDVSNGTSKANSGIIHAGYDPKENTLMAKYNIEGVKLTEEICQKLDVPYKKIGALVVAFNKEDEETIDKLYQRGLNNKVEKLEILDKEQVKKIEPNISDNVTKALYAKDSAIVSPWELTFALIETAVKNGVDLKLENKVLGIIKENDIFTIKTNKGEYQTSYVINAAGVYADKVFELIGEKEFTIIPTKGDYYLLDKCESEKVNHTIFQCPNKDGKGVLVSLTVDGNVIVGPDAKVVDNYDKSTSRSSLQYVKEKSVLSIPSLDFSNNVRNFAGIRAKSDRDDFIVEESKSVKNFFNVAGIASPGLSSALAIGKDVLNWLLTKKEFTKKETFIDTRKKIRVNQLTLEEKNELIKKDPLYGRVICRCETVTEGEIRDALSGVIPAKSIDGVKRRTNAGMGRCQGGFCSERVATIISKMKSISLLEVLQDEENSYILLAEAKENYK